MPALKELLVEQMQDLLHAENQLVKALPKLARAARYPKLKQAFQKHLEETRGHVERLKQAFELLGAKAKATPCKGMQGIVEESQEVISEAREMEESAADLALAAAGQKTEHYEICGYGMVRTIAERMGETKVARLLSQTLAEEEKTDKLLTQISAPLLEQIGSYEDEPEEVAVSSRPRARKRG